MVSIPVHLVINNKENKKNNAIHYVINKEKLNRNKIVITNSFFWRCEVSIPVSLACYSPMILHKKNSKLPIINDIENEKLSQLIMS